MCVESAVYIILDFDYVWIIRVLENYLPRVPGWAMHTEVPPDSNWGVWGGICVRYRAWHCVSGGSFNKRIPAFVCVYEGICHELFDYFLPVKVRCRSLSADSVYLLSQIVLVSLDTLGFQ